LLKIGFNTDIRLGSHVCHVQTEVRGQSRPLIETVVYQQGRVLHRRSEECADLSGASSAKEEGLRQRVEQHHRTVIEGLRSGVIKVDLDTDAAKVAQARQGVEVQLLNPASWVAAGTATLEISVLSRPERTPLPGAEIQVMLEGTQGPIKFTGRSDEQGRAQLIFPMPRIAPGGAELLIRVIAKTGSDEVRYALRTKAKTPAS
jgi:hypothetical protein